MGIVTGATHLAYDYSKEAHEEEKRWAREKREADTAREIEGERKTWWGIGSTLLCLGLGGGPICPVVGAVVGNVAKGVGTWKGQAIEDFDLSTDVGKFEKGQIEDVRNYNRALDAADKAEFWQGIQEIGTSLLFSWKYGGGGDAESIGAGIKDWSPTKWGGTAEGATTRESWDMFFDRPDSSSADIINLENVYSGSRGPKDMTRYYHKKAPLDTYGSSYIQQPKEGFQFSDELWKQIIHHSEDGEFQFSDELWKQTLDQLYGAD